MKVGNWNGTGRQGDWELIGTYPTMEVARATVEQLKAEGIDAAVTMINGLCVIAQVPSSVAA